MDTSPAPRPDATPEFLARFRARAGSRGSLPFAEFMELALYDPAVGYYQQERARIGFGAGTDFFTSTSSGPIFGRLVVAACASLLGPGAPAAMTFVEIGAEQGGGILRGVAHPFAATRCLARGEPWDFPARAVVFSNELLDAQPFRRFRFTAGRWHEIGVGLAHGALREILVEGPVPELLAEAAAVEGYVVDFPEEAARLAAAIAAADWSGLFLAIDYGKPWPELATELPAGTARAYYRHAQSNDLLARPGRQDLTCHVCWDWIEAALQANGFETPVRQSQEAFLVHHAGDAIARLLEEEGAPDGALRRSLLQLLHPANSGQKFQVVHARRRAKPAGPAPS